MLHGVLLRSAFAVAVSETMPPERPPRLLDASSTPTHVPDTPADVGLTDTVPAWLARDCATNAAAIVRVPADRSTTAVLQVVSSQQHATLWPPLSARCS